MPINGITFPPRGYRARKGVVWYSASFTVGASGAVASQDGAAVSGLVVTKQGTAGQYLIQLQPTTPAPSGRYIVELGAEMIGAPSATTVGQYFAWLTNNITAGTKAGNILLQAYNASSVAANIDSGNVLVLNIGVDFGL
jgi:hypothetical protein